MQISIQSQDFPLTQALETFIRNQAIKAMGSFSERINRLVVRLKSIKQSNGMDTPQCCIEVHLAKQPNVVVIKRSANAYSTIRHAMARAERTTLRQIGKRRNNRLHRIARSVADDEVTSVPST